MAQLMIFPRPTEDGAACYYCGEGFPDFALGGFVQVKAEDKSRPAPRFTIGIAPPLS